MKRLILSLAFALLLATPASAQWTDGFPGSSWSPGQARDAVKNGQNMSLSQIYDGLRNRYGGKPLDAQLRNGNTYMIRWETGQGHVKELTVDARDGRVLSEKGAP